ncbi:MAG: hypothetical protein RIS64_3387 [Bacteroidota bacterium]|jgi:hypothetical protein
MIPTEGQAEGQKGVGLMEVRISRIFTRFLRIFLILKPEIGDFK